MNSSSISVTELVGLCPLSWTMRFSYCVMSALKMQSCICPVRWDAVLANCTAVCSHPVSLSPAVSCSGSLLCIPHIDFMSLSCSSLCVSLPHLAVTHVVLSITVRLGSDSVQHLWLYFCNASYTLLPFSLLIHTAHCDAAFSNKDHIWVHLSVSLKDLALAVIQQSYDSLRDWKFMMFFHNFC